VQREREIALIERDRVMHGHELRPVGERPLDLHLVNHLGDAIHDLRAPEDSPPDIHQVGDTFSVANQLEELRREERDGFGVRKAKTARQALLGEKTRAVED
jgi:hypothetical protein